MRLALALAALPLCLAGCGGVNSTSAPSFPSGGPFTLPTTSTTYNGDLFSNSNAAIASATIVVDPSGGVTITGSNGITFSGNITALGGNTTIFGTFSDNGNTFNSGGSIQSVNSKEVVGSFTWSIPQLNGTIVTGGPIKFLGQD